MIAVDTSVLVYAHRTDSPSHGPAARSLVQIVERGAPWAIAWPCVHEFLAVVTNHRIFPVPSPSPRALDQVVAWRDAGAHFLAEGAGHFSRLAGLVTAAGISGPKIHDARIAALCLDQGIDELWSVDRDFSRFPGLRVRNPLVPGRRRGS